ncbi:MAG: hypothetical protein RSD40_04385 [Bacilli bacterium]
MAYITKDGKWLAFRNATQEVIEYDDFSDINSKKWTSYTQYAYAFVGLDKVNLRKYISENLKSKDTYN